MYRPREYDAANRRKKKLQKLHQWAAPFTSAVMVPPSPHGGLAKRCREVARREEGHGIAIKVVEDGGRTMKQILQRSTALAEPGCDSPECMPCTTHGRGKGGPCRRGSSQNYMVECGRGDGYVYHGESSRNGFSRMKEEIADYRRAKDGKRHNSFMAKHNVEHHNGQAGEYKFKVTHSGQPVLRRQVREAVKIKYNEKSMNDCSEWKLPMGGYTVNSSVTRNFQRGEDLAVNLRSYGGGNA